MIHLRDFLYFITKDLLKQFIDIRLGFYKGVPKSPQGVPEGPPDVPECSQGVPKGPRGVSEAASGVVKFEEKILLFY